ncbi:hypothetical protein [Algibacter lectus]
MPHGMIPIAPIESSLMLEKQNVPYFVSNAKVGILGDERVPANTFGKMITKTVAEGEKVLPILVKGASWSVIKIDENHSRLILVDPGYIDPQERKVTVSFQNKKPKSIVDILSNETLKVAGGETIEVTVPAGSMRFIDIAYR